MNFIQAQKKMAKDTEDIRHEIFYTNGKTKVVSVQHSDGSYFEFHSAIVRSLDTQWVAVFTEHHGNHLFYKEDVECIKKWYKEYKEIFLKND